MRQLWFDVGIKRYTTDGTLISVAHKLWFDVGIKRYTTQVNQANATYRCGLM